MELSLERLEDRCLLSATGTSAVFDPSLVVGAGAQSAASGAALVPPLPLEDTFFLHSNPNSSNIILLDFDGHITRGTPWNGDPTDPDATYVPTIITPPYSLDNNGLFTDTELLNIQEIWARVAEDWAPFDVDVTTEDPGTNVIAAQGIRVIIGGSTSTWYSPPNDPAGGVAYIGSFAGGADVGCFDFSADFGGDPKSVAEVASHETGHTVGLQHWGQITPAGNTVDYYPGDGPGLGFPTGWAPIMGVGYYQELTQWSKGEYQFATNVPIPDPPDMIQDDLAVISVKLPFLQDDHGDDIDNATPLDFTGTTFSGEGIIAGSEGGGANDVDFFSFDLGVEDVVFDINPAVYGPNLDILATLYDEFGEVIAISNPLDDLNATFSINTADPSSLVLDLGRYYISIDGVGKPFTTDQGYGDYGSLGYYSISAVRNSHLDVLVGVDFDDFGGITPLNWTLYPGSNGPAVFTDLINEQGVETPFDLSISSSNNVIDSFSNFIDSGTVPLHPEPLDALDGFIGDSNVTWTFTWSDLEPLTVYEVYVFGMSDTDGGNLVQIVGFDDPTVANDGPINFTQFLAADQLFVNGQLGASDRQLVEYARTIRATELGTIEITVSNDVGLDAGIAGLALRAATPGSIEGTKWNDSGVGPNNLGAGNGVRDPGEEGLPGWMIYLDLNNNGQLDFTTTPDQVVTQFSPDVPQVLLDYTSVKSALTFEQAGQILDVDVSLHISHTYDADLNVFLISPAGTRVKLFDDVGLFGDNFQFTLFDDDALVSITDGTAPFTGHFRPEEPLSAFNGENAQGDWKLELTDDAASGTGVLNSWSITVTFTTVPDQVVTQPSPDVPQDILDLATATSTLTFQQSGEIHDVDVALDISHTYDSDLNVVLISPAGTRVTLFAAVGGSGDDFQNTVLDDEALLAIASGAAPFTGRFRPDESLSTFDGEDPQGVWKLEVTDTFGLDIGLLNSWSITVKMKGDIAYLEPFTMTDVDGNYVFEDVPPGLYQVREQFSDQQTEEGWRQSWAPSPVTVRSGGEVRDIDFGNWIPIVQRGSIQGQKFNDVNGDGVKDGQESGLAGWVIYVDSNDNGVRDIATSPTTLASADVPKPITDFSTLTSQVTFDNTATVFNIAVTLDITHSFVGDLDAYLVSPSGTQVELFTGVGGQYNDFQNLTLDDAAARSIAILGFDDLPYTGTWQPEGMLSDFIGENAAGIWTLVVRDTANADEGTLNSWSLKITAGELFRVTDVDGNYRIDNLPAGEYIIREEPQPGWTQVPPATTDIPGAVWANSQWDVTIVGFDDPFDPDGPDSHRNVKNVNFGNRPIQPLNGDFDRSGVVDGADYILWRRTLGSSVSENYAGADGNGNGVVDAGDYQVWRNNFGRYIDDHGNFAVAATNLSIAPNSASGKIEVSSDVDWFAFDAVAGSSFNIATTLGTLSDSKLRLIASDGLTELAQNDNYSGLQSLITWTAPADGTYYVEVSGANLATGTYDLSITQTLIDDHGNDAATATPIAAPSTTAGDLEVPFDEDWFSFTAVSGSSYAFDTVLGSLPDSVLYVIDQDGVTILAFDDDGGLGLASHIDWTAPASGTYYVIVAGFDDEYGTYDLQVTVTAPGSGSLLDTAAGGAYSGGTVVVPGILTGSSPVAAPVAAAPVLASAPAADSRSAASAFAFDVFPIETPARSGPAARRRIVGGSATREAQNDALVAWIESRADVEAGLAFSESGGVVGEIRDEVRGDDLYGSVDSIFDELGAATVAAGCAI